MNRLERRLVVNTALAGLLLTGLIAAAEAFGLLDGLERFLYDERVARCQYFMPKPTDRLVHLDIDDAALESIDRWPWPRAKMAQILDEIRLAGPKAVALDVLYPEAQTPEWVRRPEGDFVQVDHDALLAASLKNLGSAVVPASFPFPQEPTSPLFRAVRDLLIDDPEMTPEELAARLRETGYVAGGGREGEGGDGGALGARINETYLPARREAMYVRIRREMADEAMPVAEVRPRVLRKTPPGLATPVTRVFDQQFARAVAALELRRFSKPIPPNAPTLFQARLALPTVAPLIRSAAASGFVDYPPSVDGRVRSVPLFVESEGRMHPQIGLSLACQMLGTDLRKIRFEPGRVIVPRTIGGDVAFPVHTLRARHMSDVGRDVPLSIDLPWFGGSDWRSMYDAAGNQGAGAQHVSLVSVWDVCRSRQKIDENLAQVDDAIKFIYATTDEGKLKAFEAAPPAAGDIDARLTLVREVLADEFIAASVEQAEQLAPAERGVPEQKLVSAAAALRDATSQLPLLRQQVDQLRAGLRKQLGGRAVLIGWIATAAIADFVPTPLHAKAPGPVVHGVVFNAIMTGETWRRVPAWVTVLTTLGVGLLATAIVSLLNPGKALIASMALLAAFLVLNGLVLFDWGNVILGAAGPLVVVGAVWGGGTLTRLVVEQTQRALIRRRFRSYVDPSLVDYVEAHPELEIFEGERREMTVVFLDLVGFTSLTERMGEQAVKVLNDLWSRLVPVVRANGGYVNKFLGDGIMFFYGAPRRSGDHARLAVNTLLSMRPVFDAFNAESAARDVPKLGVRFGISTGDMIVGDAGASDASDYTVLGDNVNLCARLESANKQTGTANLITERTLELCSDEGFLARPIGRLRVVGKQQGVAVFEVLARRDDATDEHKRLCDLTKEMVDAYTAGRFDACRAAIDRLEAEFGASKLTALYRENIERNVTSPAEAFDGTITLTEK